MRAIFCLCCLLLAAPTQAKRILVLPLSGSTSADTKEALGRAVETAVGQRAVGHEVMTAQALSASIDLAALRECAGEEASCVSEISDAANADVLVRPHLAALGDELVLTITLSSAQATLLSQVQRRVAASRVASLLDQIPAAVDEAMRDANLVGDAPGRAVPKAPFVIAGGGLVFAAIGVTALVVRGVMSGGYQRAEYDRDGAILYETTQVPLLVVGIGTVVIGGAGIVGGAGLAVAHFAGGE